MAAKRRKEPERKAKGAYHHGNLRRAIMDAVVALLEEADHDSFTVREAARRVGVDHGAVYKHFENRDALLAAVAAEGYTVLTAISKAKLAAVPPSDTSKRLLALANGYLQFAAKTPGLYRLMTGSKMDDGGGFKELEIALAIAYGLMQGEIADGVARGDLTPVEPREASLILWSAMHGLASLMLTRRIKVRRDLVGTFAERAVGVTVRGMLKSPQR